MLKDSRGIDYKEKLVEVKNWAESELGRPPLPVVGAINTAFEKVVAHLSWASKNLWDNSTETANLLNDNSLTNQQKSGFEHFSVTVG